MSRPPQRVLLQGQDYTAGSRYQCVRSKPCILQDAVNSVTAACLLDMRYAVTQALQNARSRRLAWTAQIFWGEKSSAIPKTNGVFAFYLPYTRYARSMPC